MNQSTASENASTPFKPQGFGPDLDRPPSEELFADDFRPHAAAGADA
jgi:hypothetical protein